jgi:hypothetical protein
MSNSLNQPNQVNSFHVDIASEISQATRGKIQRSEYIDLALLLSNIMFKDKIQKSWSL